MLQRRFSAWPLQLALLTSQLVSAQQPEAFYWGPTITQTELTECGTLKVVITPLTGQTNIGTAPYFMYAFQPGGPTTTANIGSDPNNLQWTIDHPAGSSVVLLVTDSLGNSGGVADSYFVNDGTTSSCHSNTPSPIQLTTTSTQLVTCDPLVLDISGGQKPYTVIIAPTNADAVTNVTMGPNDDQYTWINRADPGHGLVAVVIDATGTYSQTTNLITLSGPTDTTCPGAVSASGTQAGSPSSAPSNPNVPPPTSSTSPSGPSSVSPFNNPVAAASNGATSGNSGSKKRSIVAPVVGSVVGALVIGCIITAFLIFFCNRRNRRGVYDGERDARRATVLSTTTSAKSGATRPRKLRKESGRPLSQMTESSALGVAVGVNGADPGWRFSQHHVQEAATSDQYMQYQNMPPQQQPAYSSNRSQGGMSEYQSGVETSPAGARKPRKLRKESPRRPLSNASQTSIPGIASIEEVGSNVDYGYNPYESQGAGTGGQYMQQYNVPAQPAVAYSSNRSQGGGSEYQQSLYQQQNHQTDLYHSQYNGALQSGMRIPPPLSVNMRVEPAPSSPTARTQYEPQQQPGPGALVPYVPPPIPSYSETTGRNEPVIEPSEREHHSNTPLPSFHFAGAGRDRKDRKE